MNTDNVEAFLFELNELLRKHRASLSAVRGGPILVAANGQEAFVVKNDDRGHLEIDPSHSIHSDNDE